MLGVFAYVYGLLLNVKSDNAIQKFLEHFPEWNCEKESFNPKSIQKRINKKLGNFYSNGNFNSTALKLLEDPAFGMQTREAIKARIQYYLKFYYRQRYQGILREPDELIIGHNYSRPEIINHFKTQYDPQKHERGVVLLMEDEQIALFVNLKKGKDRALRDHDYRDKILSRNTFQWESQNRDHPGSKQGKLYINHAQERVQIHLFVQPTQGKPYMYLGRLRYVSHDGERPMRINSKFEIPLKLEFVKRLYPNLKDSKDDLEGLLKKMDNLT